MTTDEPTPDERRRAAEWLRARAKKHTNWKSQWAQCGERQVADAHRLKADALNDAADAYERGEQP